MYKTLFSLIVAGLISLPLLSQEDIESKPNKACVSGMIFTIVEEYPAYEGGDVQLLADLNELISAEGAGPGRMHIRAAVNCKGKIFNTLVLSKANPELSDKIAGYIMTLQKWSPGKQRNIAVDCYVDLEFKVIEGQITLLGN